MKIAVFGTGIVGQVISVKLASLGYDVIVGTRDVNNTLSRTGKDNYGNPSFSEWYQTNKSSVRVATFNDAAKEAAMIFNCTSGKASVDALLLAGSENIEGKIIVDVANPLDFSNGAPPTLSPVNTDSLGELIQRTFPTAKVVKALNTMTCFLMVNPSLIPGNHNVFICGNDAVAKRSVTALLGTFGWKDEMVLDLGDITSARGTEQLLPIWLRLWSALKTPMFNFNIVIAK